MADGTTKTTRKKKEPTADGEAPVKRTRAAKLPAAKLPAAKPAKVANPEVTSEVDGKDVVASADKPKRKAAAKTATGADKSSAKSTANKPAASKSKKSAAKGDTEIEAVANGASSKVSPEVQGFARAAAQYAIDKKATNVRILDLSEITSITDYFIIASGDSDRQVKAIAENVVTEMRDEHGQSPFRSEGWDSQQWIILDFVDFVVHVFQAEARLFYNLERLWADAPVEDVQDNLEPLTTAVKKGRSKKSATSDEETPVRRNPIVRILDESEE